MRQECVHVERIDAQNGHGEMTHYVGMFISILRHAYKLRMTQDPLYIHIYYENILYSHTSYTTHTITGTPIFDVIVVIVVLVVRHTRTGTPILYVIVVLVVIHTHLTGSPILNYIVVTVVIYCHEFIVISYWSTTKIRGRKLGSSARISIQIQPMFSPGR